MTNTATVETLTAEVRVLMVGSRQVTLSVYRQLDLVDIGEVEPMGRVHAGAVPQERRLPGFGGDEVVTDPIELVGRRKDTGELCRAVAYRPQNPRWWRTPDDAAVWQEEWDSVSDLPLIVLAGLR